MNLARAARLPLSVLGATTTLSPLTFGVLAQTPRSSSPADMSPAGATGGDEAALALVMLALIAIIVCHAVQLLGIKHTGTDAAASLQDRIADALLRHPELGSLPIVATARMPRWRRSPVRIEVGGVVPSPAYRETAIALIIREAFTSGPHFRVADRLVVDAARSCVTV